MKKNRGSKHSLQKKASAAVGSCLRSVRLPALLVLFLILFSFIFINTNYQNLDVSALPNAAASPDNDLSFFNTMLATSAPNNAGSVYRSEYEIVPGKVYKLGDCDKHVSDMQQRLMLLGYLPSDEPSDVFNKPLEQAVKLFQRANHLAQSGEADETLLRLLYSDAPAEYVIEYGNVGNDVRMLQERLMQLGYYSEKTNGYFGTATRTAVGQFRLSNNLPESSVVDTEVFNLIFSAYAVDDGNLPFETGGPYYTVSPAPSPDACCFSDTHTAARTGINAVAETNCNCNCVRRTDRSPDTVAETHTDAKADVDTKSDAVACANPDISTRAVTRA